MSKHTVALSKTEKEILGYSIKMIQYISACTEINRAFRVSKEKINFETNGLIHESFIKAGVMHWFSPVYTKELIVDDLKNNDHIGFIYDINKKGYVCYMGEGLFASIGYDSEIEEVDPKCNTILRGASYQKSIKEALPYTMHSLFKFDTRKELYSWLAE